MKDSEEPFFKKAVTVDEAILKLLTIKYAHGGDINMTVLSEPADIINISYDARENTADCELQW